MPSSDEPRRRSAAPNTAKSPTPGGAGVRRGPPRRGAGPRVSDRPEVEIPFSKKNYILFAVAAAVILAGYWFLARGSITLAPIMLLIGYLVLVPWGILAK